MNEFKEASTVEKIQYYVVCPNCNGEIESIDAKLELSPSQIYYGTRYCEECNCFYDIKVCQDGQTLIKKHVYKS